ncbi:hypothetical protein Tco_0837233 [Tanacetum coccineum]
MAGLDFCSKHNMVAYLEKNDGNTEFHQIMDFLTHSSIHFALTGKLFRECHTIFNSMLVQPKPGMMVKFQKDNLNSQPLPFLLTIVMTNLSYCLGPSPDLLCYHIPDSIPKGSGGIPGGHDMLAQQKKDIEKSKKKRSVFKQGRKAVKSSKGAPSVPTNWDDLDDLEATLDEAMDYTLAKDEGKTDSRIDQKPNRKGMIEEEDESNTESEDITEDEKKFKMLANDEEMARKVQEVWEAEDEKERLAEEEATKAAFTKEYDFIQARLNADKILAEKLQEEEREKFTIEERADMCTDKAKTTRKPDKHGHEERKSTQEAGDSIAKRQKDKTSLKLLIGQYPSKDATWIVKKAQGMKQFTLNSLTEEAH